MTIATVSAYRVEILDGAADHTYVAQGTQGNPPPDYFACWGTQYVQSPHPAVCTGNINLGVANCCRGAPVWEPGLGWCPDTARIGAYLVNGVCHQSANCFLLSSGAHLDFTVIGYWASLLAFGPCGTGFTSWWLPFVYGVCGLENPAIAAELPEAAVRTEPTVVDDLRDLYASFQAQPQPPDAHDVIIQEAATVVRHYEPSFDPSVYRDLHAEFLNKKDAAIATGETGKTLADKINELSKELQGELAHRLDPAMYRRLSGVEPGKLLDICDPRLAAAAGVQVPTPKG
jgi:hypothetical protein